MKDIYFDTERIYWKKLSESDFDQYRLCSDRKLQDHRTRRVDGSVIKSGIKELVRNTLFGRIAKRWVLSFRDCKYRLNYLKIDDRSGFSLIITKRKMFKGKKIPFIYYIENYHSIMNFRKNRNNRYILRKLGKKFASNNFRGFVFMSEFSRRVFYNKYEGLFLMESGPSDLGVIYPYVEDVHAAPERDVSSNMTLLYVSSVFELKSGKEVLDAFLSLGPGFSLVIITVIDTIHPEDMDIINRDSRIILKEHNLSFEDMKDIYYDTDLVLHPTYMDSSAVAVLEAVKFSIPVVATSTFAICEYVIDHFNGILISNPYNCYREDGATYLDEFFDDRDFILEITGNSRNRSFAVQIAQSVNEIRDNFSRYKSNAISHAAAENFRFGSDAIIEKWKKIFSEALK